MRQKKCNDCDFPVDEKFCQACQLLNDLFILDKNIGWS